MDLAIRVATKRDIKQLIDFRLAYLEEDTGGLTEVEKECLLAQLPDYFSRHLGLDMTAYIAEMNGQPLSTVFVVRLEKPANVHFLNGRTAYLMNVFTYSEHRKKGYASQILNRLFVDARNEGITCIDASSTPAGKALYLKNGFQPRINTEMRIELS